MSAPRLGDLTIKGLEEAARYQREIIEAGDTEAFSNFLHPSFIINGPNNQCGAKEQVVKLFEAGAMAHQEYEQRIEQTAVTENIGVVMGNEIVKATIGTPMASAFGTEPVRRRFTDVYLFNDGEWKFLARQASVVGIPRET